MFNRKKFNPDLKAASRAIMYLNAAERELLKIESKHHLAYPLACEHLENAKKWIDEVRYLAKFHSENED